MEKTTGLSSAADEGRSSAIRLAWIGGFAALTAIGAQVEIPHQPVPYTLQTFFVLLAGAMLGKRDGPLSQVLYLVAGIAGVPVFAHWSFGAARLLGPTGGYLLGFPIAAFVVAYVARDHSNLLRSFVAMALGLFVIFSLGTLQLYWVYTHNFPDAFVSGFLIFSWWDVLKLIAAAAIAHTFSRFRARR